MDKNDMMRKIAFAFDRFIQDTGGNLDPRSNNNKQRCALIRFWEAIRATEEHLPSYMEVDKCMREIIKGRTTFNDFRSDKKYAVYNDLGETVKE